MEKKKKHVWRSGHASEPLLVWRRLSHDLAKDLAILAKEIHDVAGDGDCAGPCAAGPSAPAAPDTSASARQEVGPKHNATKRVVPPFSKCALQRDLLWFPRFHARPQRLLLSHQCPRRASMGVGAVVNAYDRRAEGCPVVSLCRRVVFAAAASAPPADPPWSPSGRKHEWSPVQALWRGDFGDFALNAFFFFFFLSFHASVMRALQDARPLSPLRHLSRAIRDNTEQLAAKLK